MSMQHHAGTSVRSGVREATTDVFQQTRQLLLDAMQHPDVTNEEKAQLQAQLNELHAEFGEVENTETVRGLRSATKKRNAADRVFRDFQRRLEGVADEILIGFGHLLGTEAEVTPRAAVTAGGPGSKGTGSEEPAELMSGQESLALFRQSPEEFSSYYRALSPEDRQLATMSLQEEMQAQNQLFSLLSNMQQAEHQTGRSIVSNIRV